MPRLSLVLVTHHEQGHLRRGVRSLLAQVDALDHVGGGDDVELLVVDDASTDHTAEILAELVAQDGRLRVHRCAERAGPAAARLAALDLVTGDHVWFVEPTDVLPPGALDEVLAALADRPPVLVVDHLLRAYDGKARRVKAPAGGTPWLWDSVITSGLLREHLTAAVGAGGGWEVAAAWGVALAAGDVRRLGATAYVRRVLPQAVRRRTDPRPARAVAAAYAELVRDLPPTAATALRAAVVEAALGQVEQLPLRLRGAQLAAVAAAWQDLGEDAQALLRLHPAQRRALDAGSYPAWRAVGEAARTRRGARGAVRAARRGARQARRLPGAARSWPLQAWYRAQLRRPLEPDLAVYAAYWFAAYSCNPRAVYEKARELAPWVRGVWVVDADKQDRVPAGVPLVVTGTRDYYRVLARATYLVNNVNFPNDFVKRPGQVHLQTHHGTPVKTMGLDLVDAAYGRRRMNFDRLVERVAKWDLSVSQNAFTTEQWERVYPGTYESIETGYPRNDVLAVATPEQVAAVRAGLGIAEGTTAVLYTPTHREYHKGFVPQLDPAQLAAALGPDHVLLVRAHYFYADSPMGAEPAPGVVDVADHPRIEDLYLAADVLVTDYSSVMFDYAVLDRPIVVFASDWEEYVSLRGTYVDLLTESPGPVVRTQEELAEVLVTRRAWDDGSTALRRAFRARFCSLEDGRAAERVVRRLWPAPVEDG
jgi:CDP-glycerol glycerophosphotransferase